MRESAEPILIHVLRVERLVFESPVVCAGLYRCAPRDPLFPSGNPCSSTCIVFPREPVWIERDGSRRFVADPSVATMYNRGQVYRRWTIGGRADRSDWLGFPPALVRELVAAFDEGDAERPLDVLRFTRARVDASLYRAQRDLFTQLERGHLLEALAVEEQALELLAGVLRSAYASHQRSATVSGSGRVRDAVEHTRQNIARDPSSRKALSELARACGMSPFHLCREFRRTTGQTISNYRVQLRLRASLEPVAAGHDLATVAFDLGFTSHSHFTSAFRRAFGVVPSALRHRRFAPDVRAGLTS